MIINSPCKDCQNRISGCHDNCEEYKAYRVKKEEYDEMIRKGKAEHFLYTDYLKSAKRQMKFTSKRRRG